MDAAGSAAFLRNVVFLEEKEIDSSIIPTMNDFYQYFEMKIIESNCDAIFIDNITTSKLYASGLRPAGQEKSAKVLNSIAKKLNKVIFYVAHTRKEITDNYHKLITNEDIRGSAQIAIESEYFYILQKFSSNGTIFNVVRVTKHRHHHNVHSERDLFGHQHSFHCTRFVSQHRTTGTDLVNTHCPKRTQCHRSHSERGWNKAQLTLRHNSPDPEDNLFCKHHWHILRQRCRLCHKYRNG